MSFRFCADHGAKLDIRDYGNTDNRGGKLAVHTWEPVDYADGLVRVGVQSAIPHPETGLLLRKLMTAAGPAGTAGRPHARIHLHHRRLRLNFSEEFRGRAPRTPNSAIRIRGSRCTAPKFLTASSDRNAAPAPTS